MPDANISIDRNTVLVIHPSATDLTTSSSQTRVVSLLNPALSAPMVMTRLRALLPDSLRPGGMTDQQVLTWVADKVMQNQFAIRTDRATQIAFATLWSNYPTNQDYPTPPTAKPNIWTYIGGKVQVNGTSADPDSKANPPDMVFSNSCAIRMSRALNYSGAKLSHLPHTSSGKDGFWYLYRVADLEPQMNRLFGKAETLTLSRWRSQIDGRTGVVKFSAAWANATGHFTLWDGKQMINGPNDEDDATASVVNGVKFWSVK